MKERATEGCFLVLLTERIQPSIYFISFHKREQKHLYVIVFLTSASENDFFFYSVGVFLLTNIDFFHFSSTFPGYFHLLLFLPLCPDWVVSSSTQPKNYVSHSWNKEHLKIKSLAQINLDHLKQEVIFGRHLIWGHQFCIRPGKNLHSTMSCFQQWSAAEAWGKSLCGVVLFSTRTSAKHYSREFLVCRFSPSNEYHQQIYL